MAFQISNDHFIVTFFIFKTTKIILYVCIYKFLKDKDEFTFKTTINAVPVKGKSCFL